MFSTVRDPQPRRRFFHGFLVPRLSVFRRMLTSLVGFRHGLTLTRSLTSIGMTADRMVDPQYPGTAVARMLAARERAKELTSKDLSGEWEAVRKKILFAAGLRDITNAPPGQGYTGHAFNDANHCDATTMLGDVAHNLNQEGPSQVQGIAVGNRLGPGIEVASLPELGEGGTWSTCTNGCHLEPPQDVCCTRYQTPARRSLFVL